MRFLILFSILFSLQIFANDLGFQSETTTLAVAGTRQPLLAAETRAFDFVVQNPEANTDSIFVGGADVTTSGAAQGIELVPGAVISLSASEGFGKGKLMVSSNIYMVSDGTAVPVTVAWIIR